MDVVKINIEYFLKCLLLLIFMVFFTHNLINYNLSRSLFDLAKNSTYNIVITGGSNIMFGLRAEVLDFKTGANINLGLPREGIFFRDYINWLKKLNIKTQTTIYSPVSFWDVNENDESSLSIIGKFKELFPQVSLIRYILNIYAANQEIYPRNNTGDLNQFKCSNYIQTWHESKEFLTRAYAASNHFKERITKIQEATNADLVILRIPPILVSESNKRKFEPIVKEVLEAYRKQGIILLPQLTILSTDKSLFCDAAHHPNLAGRSFFTQELADALLEQRRSITKD